MLDRWMRSTQRLTNCGPSLSQAIACVFMRLPSICLGKGQRCAMGMRADETASNQRDAPMKPKTTASAQSDQRRLLRSREAAAFLAVSERTLWSMAKRGEIQVVRCGRAIRYDPLDLVAWIQGAKECKEARRP